MGKDVITDKKWKWMAPLGLTLIGLGVSLSGEATLLKGAAAPTWHWVAIGTLGLVVLNSGIAVFGDAVKRRLWLEIRASRPWETAQPTEA